MIVEILFILHVANGIYLIIHNVIWYNYTYLNTIIPIFVRIGLIIFELVQTIAYLFLYLYKYYFYYDIIHVS